MVQKQARIIHASSVIPNAVRELTKHGVGVPIISRCSSGTNLSFAKFFLPIVFDFENASNKSVDETVNLLARMSRFIIADITVADLPLHEYESSEQLLKNIIPSMITPVEQKVLELKNK